MQCIGRTKTAEKGAKKHSRRSECSGIAALAVAETCRKKRKDGHEIRL